MRSIVCCLIFTLFTFVGFSQEGGVVFEDLTYKEALEKAKKENKLVFLDGYTQWCGPCKGMARAIFPLKKVGDFFNPRFVCVKYDMEAGEGIELAKKFNIKSYPTFLIIRPDGTVQHRINGGTPRAEDFIAWVEMGLNEETALYPLSQVYASGKMTKKQMANYHVALVYGGFKEKDAEIKKELAGKLTDKEWLQNDFFFLLKENGYGTERFNFAVKNISTLRKNMENPEEVDSWLFYVYQGAIRPYFSSEKFKTPEGISDLKEIGKSMKSVKADQLELSKSHYALVNGYVNKNVESVMSALKDKKFCMNGDNVRVVMKVLEYMADQSQEQAQKLVAAGEKMVPELDVRLKKNLNDLIAKYKQ
ncbi:MULTISPECIES: thioredoxin family protein [Butyricimonas]|uniref:thioredoxin family protein n=1 Tax=Butyricimonas TaxID=574697 RepID=UPI0007FB4971|nr:MULTISPECIES: thioredoxin family protein [Butyricimonas]